MDIWTYFALYFSNVPYLVLYAFVIKVKWAKKICKLCGSDSLLCMIKSRPAFVFVFFPFNYSDFSYVAQKRMRDIYV